MKLVILYGPPAVGKLTVARELEKLTGFPVFHNHLTVDFLDPLIGFGSPLFYRTLERVRLVIFEALAEAEAPGLIFTFVYAKPNDDPFVQKMVESVERFGGEASLVRLTCTREELLRRVADPSRKTFGKITTVEQLEKNLTEADIVSEISFRPGLALDTNQLSPRAAAETIARHFRLP